MMIGSVTSRVCSEAWTQRVKWRPLFTLFFSSWHSLLYFLFNYIRVEIRKINAGAVKIDCDHNFIPLAKHLECTGPPLNTL